MVACWAFQRSEPVDHTSIMLTSQRVLSHGGEIFLGLVRSDF